MKRVVLVADGGWPTGFERVARAIGTFLHETGQYEVIHRGIGYDERNQKRVPDYPYEIKPAIQDPSDPLAFNSVTTWMKEDKPDLMLFVQDLWNQGEYLHLVPRDLPTVGYFPTDTPNVKWSYALSVAAMSEAVPYTTFGAQETALGVRDAVDILVRGYAGQGVPMSQEASWLVVPRKELELNLRVDRLAARQNPDAYRPIAHGIEPDKFYPVDRQEARRAWGLPEDAFVVLGVNTNQFRKRQDITIRAFAKFAANHPKALLVLHCQGGDSQLVGWDLGQLARLYGVADKVICTHWGLPEITDEQLLLLYNTADVHINTGGGEGWGLTAIESALCGIPQLVPDWSATREIWKGAGGLLPVHDYRFETRQLNTAHAIVSTDATAHLLSYLASNETARVGMGNLCRERALSMPSWTEVGRQFEERVRLALQESPVETLTLQQIVDARRGNLLSELLID